MKRLLVLCLAVILFAAAPMPVYARTGSAAAGAQVTEIIDLIMSRYVGGPVTVDELLEAALRGIADALDDYSVYFSAAELEQFMGGLTGRRVGIGVSMAVRYDGRIEISRVFPNSPAERAGVLPGDIFVTVDGNDTYGMTTGEIAAIVTNPDTERTNITFERDGLLVTFDILKEDFRFPTVMMEDLEGMPEAQGLYGLNEFRYLHIDRMGPDTGNDLRQAISQMQSEGVQGIILDLRSNAGGYLDVTVDIANQLVPAGVVLQTVNRVGRRSTYSSTLQEVPFDNVIVLVNRFTASAAEVIASALQDSGAAVIIGETTYGKGSVQSFHGLRTGGAMRLTTEEYFRRNGGTINGVGVEPCISIPRRLGPEEPDHVLRRGMEILVGN